MGLNYKALIGSMMIFVLAVAIAASGCTSPTPANNTSTATPTAASTTGSTNSTPTTTGGSTQHTTTSSTTTTAADTPPKTYSNTGEQMAGPISLKAASTTFKIKCSDAKDKAFTVNLQNSATGENIDNVGQHGVIYTNTGAGPTRMNNEIDDTEQYVIPSADNYQVYVNCDPGASWEISISQ